MYPGAEMYKKNAKIYKKQSFFSGSVFYVLKHILHLLI